jgi:threonine dehydrogenase-like Zn-dependent dehydrogenase
LLGVYACAWLKHRLGFKHVFCIDRNEYRVPYSRHFGATPLLAAKDRDNFVERFAEVKKVAPHGVDVVVEMTGSPGVVPEGIKMLRFGGHYAFAGNSLVSFHMMSLPCYAQKCLTIVLLPQVWCIPTVD